MGSDKSVADYRRFRIPGSTWFFTVNLAERRNNHLLVDQIDLLREAFRYV
jgi:putative transposase